MILRAIKRHWWMIGLLWTVLSTALAILIYVGIKPRYEATSLLRVEPVGRDLFGLGAGAADSFEPFLQTQVHLIKGTDVLLAAAADPTVAKQPTITSAEDVELELNRLLQVGVIPGTFLIKVSMESISAAETSAVVNAVVRAYLQAVGVWANTMNETHIKNLRDYLEKLRRQAQEKEAEWVSLADKGNIDPPSATPGQVADSLTRPTRSSVTLEQYKRARDELFKINIELVEAESLLGSLQGQAGGAESKTSLAQRIQSAFHADPDVAEVLEQMEQARQKLDTAKRLARSASDPAAVAQQRRLKALQARYQKLWQIKSSAIQNSTEAVQAHEGGELTVAGLNKRIEALKASKAGYEKMLSSIEVLNRQEGSDAVRVALLREALGGLKEMQLAVTKRLEQVQFEARGNARINQVSEARTPTKPTNDKRRKLLAAMPFCVLFGVMGLVVVLERRAQRIADPRQLSLAMQAAVFSLPPLPVPHSPGWLPRSDRQRDRLEEYVQGLDHLRVALVGESLVKSGRCLLITSAVGGEGKTTLASQLATRCANSGLSTLLIDADLRRGSLSRLFDVPEDLGLSDVLLGDVAVDSVLLSLQSYAFKLLPAGTPGSDPGRVLRGKSFGSLIAHFRQTFDAVIIDSPPLLPVPDALILGRWTDGAVLASRYDVSRLSLVELAGRRLDAAGIPVLGTVVNGVQSAQAYYQHYTYSRRAVSPPELSP
jgi:capsular exopolysaccharide synthesis family protein